MRLIRVASLDDPRHRDALAGYASLKDRDLRGSGSFIAEGALVVRELIRSRFPTESVLLAEHRLEAFGDALEDLPADTPVYLAPQPVLDGIVGFHVHRGVLALGRRLPPPDPAELLRNAPAAVVLEDLANADNVGGIFRAVAALAPTGTPVLLSPRCCDPLYRKAVRVSIGHALRVPFTTLAPWPDALHTLHAGGFVTLALTPNVPDASEPLQPGSEPIKHGAAPLEPEAAPIQAGARPSQHGTEPFQHGAGPSQHGAGPSQHGAGLPQHGAGPFQAPLLLHQLPLAFRWALLLGSEGPGLSDAALRACTHRVRIPMSPGVDSLNVVVAAGIALHALNRSRTP